MPYRRIIKTTAGGVALVYGLTLAGDYVFLASDPHHAPQADSFGVVVTSTASDTGMIGVQDTVSGDEIEIPFFPTKTVLKS